MIDIMVNMNFYMYIITLSMDNKLATGFIVVGFFVIVRIILHIHALSERCERPTCTFAFCKILLV